MCKQIVVLAGDGIGPEIMSGTLEVLQLLSHQFQFDYELEEHLMGGCAIDQYGTPLPEHTLSACKRADAILLGAIGGPKWQNASVRPEQGLLKLRQSLRLYANIRPTRVLPSMVKLSPLKEEIVSNTDFIIVRELTGGIYFGEPRVLNAESAIDTLVYTKSEIEQIAHVAFQLAQQRRQRVTSVDKENVLASSKLWRQTLNEVARFYPDVTLEHLLVDACSMKLIQNPQHFDIIVTENLFGDVLSDEASMLPGSLGLSPSSSKGHSGINLYEPIHGSAPDIAGQNTANPFGMLLSLAMCLRETFQAPKAAALIEKSIAHLITENITTADLGGHYKTTDIIENIKAYIKEA
ncbi:3-isopropylmalate dehydrogenase [Staphylococcus agnetis]|uniref:3-isopropylmalate dehydrogenase n=1 Tax=Staphylococcus agnetis TaxID=985762 RepID=UPI0021CE0C99|nr:3-isopropylmalate dehydrogenase [Staphylococcus agnetis]UXU55695.1 3-isopropylmalate dehydrogenase [Staphylococcus agnetis]